MCSCSIKIEYYRSVEYSMKLKSVVSPTRSKRSKTSRMIQESPRSTEDDIKRRVWRKSRRVGLTQPRAEEQVRRMDLASSGDIIDIISREEAAEHVSEDDGEILVELSDTGVDDSDEEKASDTSSMASGPSAPFPCPPMTLRTHILCSACRKRHQTARKMKVPLKDKLLDNNPSSLTCDQWILIKTWRSHRPCTTTGKLSARVQLMKTQLQVDSSVRDGEAAACSRPHVFLQRNLRRCAEVLVKSGRKKNQRKRRRRPDSQGSRIAKQQCLHGNHGHIRAGAGRPPPVRRRSDGLVIGRSGSSGSDNSKDADPSFEAVPASVSMETTAQGDAQSETIPKQKAPKRAGGFKDLLAQLRGTNSVVVREAS